MAISCDRSRVEILITLIDSDVIHLINQRKSRLVGMSAAAAVTSPVELTVTISMRETTREMPAAASGPKRKPAMQMMTSLRSKFRKPRTLTGMSLERYITT